MASEKARGTAINEGPGSQNMEEIDQIDLTQLELYGNFDSIAADFVNLRADLLE